MIRVFIILLFIILLFPQKYFVLNNTYSPSEIQINNHIKKDVISYIINLDKSKDRYELIYPKVIDVGFDTKKIKAIYGNDLSVEEKSKLVDFDSYIKNLGHFPKNGTIGCSLSHIKLWEEFLKSDYKYALIFEDDVIFDPYKLRKIVDDLIEKSNLWDIVSFEMLHNGFPLNIEKISSEHNLSIYISRVSHTGSYLINRNAALKLLSKSLPIKMPIDHYFTRSWEFDLKFSGIEPRIVFQNAENSEINNTLQSRENVKNITIYYNKTVYEVQSALIRAAYNFKLYFTR